MSPHSLPAANPPSLPAELSQPASLLSSHFTHKPSLPPQGLPFSSPLLNSSSHVRRQRVSKQAAEPCISQLCFSHGGSSSSGALRSWFLSRGIQATGFLILHPPGSAEEGVGGGNHCGGITQPHSAQVRWIQVGFARAAPSPSGSPSLFCLSSGSPGYIRLKPLVSRMISRSFISPRLPPFLPRHHAPLFIRRTRRAFRLSLFSLSPHTRPTHRSLPLLLQNKYAIKNRGERADRI